MAILSQASADVCTMSTHLNDATTPDAVIARSSLDGFLGGDGESLRVHRPFNGLVVKRQPLTGAVCLSLSGEVDLANASDLRAHLDAVAENDNNLIVDMSELRYIDSSGIKTLVDAHRRLGQAKRKMALAAVTPTVQKILSIVGVDRVVPIFPSIDAAFKNLGGNA